jgi:hypothetical protein
MLLPRPKSRPNERPKFTFSPDEKPEDPQWDRQQLNQTVGGSNDRIAPLNRAGLAPAHSFMIKDIIVHIRLKMVA